MQTSRFRILIISAVLLLASTNLFAEPWHWQFLPHVAAGGGWTSYLTINDPHGVSSRTVWVFFYDDNGQALTLNVDGLPESTFNFTLAANQEKTFVINSGATPFGGQVQIAAQGIERLNVSLRFAYSNGSGSTIDAIGVLPVMPNSSWSFPIDKQRLSDNMGVGISIPWSNVGTVTVSFDLYQNGRRVPGTSSVTRSIASLGHLSLFASELFPDVVYGGTATLKISSSQTTFCAIALRADGSQYSSLSVDAAVQSWSVKVTGVSGVETWAWRFIEGYSFFGAGTNPNNADKYFAIRGVCATDLSPQYFLLEWNYVNSGDYSQGMMIFQGTISRENGVDVINGTRQDIKLDGTIVGTATFKATRIS
jgi:hypothetical protein